ncbi:MAG: hypothetical protein JNL58_10875 [Planctomyces sp.]|nr:hypothetical protein [Planctomyces sp.]
MQASLAPEAFLSKYARAAVRSKACRLSCCPGFKRQEQPDLEQELWVALFAQIAKFDPQRASIDTFVECVLSTKVFMLIRERRREKRQPVQHARRPGQNTEPPGDAFAAEMTEDGDQRRYTESHEARLRHSEDCQAIQFVMNQLPSELQAICRSLMVLPAAAASRKLGISRRQLRRAVEDVRAHFTNAGFEE